MRWSFKILTVAGIGIYVHITFLMLIAYFAIAFLESAGALAAAFMIGLVLSLFGCVILHELGHALTAMRFGVKTRDITLLPIGGVARLERIPREPKQEFLIAIAGPLVNVAIALVLTALIWSLGLAVWPATEGAGMIETPEEGPPELIVGWKPYLRLLLLVNVMMFLFNLVPAFPMDGGRILRSLLATRMSHHKATKIAASAGQLFAVVFGIWGLMNMHLLLVLIAVFVFLGAAGEASVAQMHYAFRGLPTSMGMVTEFKTLTRDSTLAEAVELLLRGNQVDFPVLDDGKVLGLLTRQQLVKSLRESGPETLLANVALKEVEPIDADIPLDRAYEKMVFQEIRCLPVLRDGELVGLITSENIGDLAMVRQALDRE